MSGSSDFRLQVCLSDDASDSPFSPTERLRRDGKKMSPTLQDSAAAAMRTLQEWYGADSYAKSTGLYHWDDPNFAHDNNGAVIAAVLSAYGYRPSKLSGLIWPANCPLCHARGNTSPGRRQMSAWNYNSTNLLGLTKNFNKAIALWWAARNLSVGDATDTENHP
jgi:hypothetical protein